MNINQKLAFDSLKKNKNDSKALIILSVIIFTLLISISICLPTYFDADNQQNLKDNGKWIYYAVSVDFQGLRYLKDNNEEVVATADLGVANYDTGYLVTGVESNFDKLVNTENIIEGDFPQEGEIALSKILLNKLGYQGNIGETVRIDYQDNENNQQTVIARLSGVIIDTTIYDSTYLNSFMETATDVIKVGDVVLPFEDAGYNYNCYVYDQKLDNASKNDMFYDVFNEKSDFQSYQIIYNNGYQSSFSLQFNQSVNFLMIISIAILIGVTIMVGVTLSSVSRKTKEFVLLRAIGQTKRQLSKMLIYQVIVVCLVGIVIGIIISLLVSEIVLYLIKRFIFSKAGFVVEMKLIVAMLMIGGLMIVVGMFIPSLHASKKAMLGVFDEDKFNIFSYHHKKIYHQNMFNLARREFSRYIKINIILIIILSITFSSINKLIISNDEYQENMAAYNQSLKTSDIRITGFAGTGLTKEQIGQLEPYTNDIYYYKKISVNEGCYYQQDEQTKFFEEVDRNQEKNICSNQIDYYCFDFDNNSKKIVEKIIEGRLPKTSNEIVVFKRAEINNESNNLASMIGKNLTVYEEKEGMDGLNNQVNYTIVGVINELPNNNIIYFQGDFVNIGLIVNESEFKKKVIKNDMTDQYNEDSYNQIYLTTTNQISLLAKINQFNINNEMNINVFSDYYANQNTYLKNELYQTAIFSLACLGLSMFLFAFISKYRIINNAQTIGILKSLGTTKFQIYRLHLYHALMLCLGALIISVWSLVYNYNLNGFDQYLCISFLLIDLIIIVIVSTIYCGSLRGILKKDTIKLIKIKE